MSQTIIQLSWQEPRSNQTVSHRASLPITIGRRDSHVIYLNERQVSGDHARLDFVEGKVVLTDTNSTNHTYVNGRAIQSVTLAVGDQFQIGSFVLTLSNVESGDEAGQLSQVQCINCNHKVSMQEIDCPWCGYSLASANTVYPE